MYSRNVALAVRIAFHLMVATLHCQSNSNGQLSPQKLLAHRPNAESAVLVPEHTYRDSLASGGKGPKMIVVPDGKFAMGSAKDETGREENEGPMQEVIVRSFALGESPVTRGEFARFASATGYKTDAEKDTPSPFSRPNLEPRSPAMRIGR